MVVARVPLRACLRASSPGHPPSRRGASPRPPTKIVPRFGQRVVCKASAAPGSLADMQVTLVSVDVKPGDEEDFASESIANALASVEEPENCRFDVLRAVEDPSKFLLVEIYGTAAGPVAHKETDHYAQWRENVQDMMATPRSARKYVPVYPWPGLWGTAAASRRAREAELPRDDERVPDEDESSLNEKASTFLTLDAVAADEDALGAAYANADALDVEALIDSFGDTKVITHVHVSCVPGTEDAFAEASTANAASSVLEPGNLRFDVLRAADDPRAFLLVEVYDSPEAAAAHKQTPHYAEWREEVQDMMAEPRQATAYVARFPEDPGAWKMRLSEA